MILQYYLVFSSKIRELPSSLVFGQSEGTKSLWITIGFAFWLIWRHKMPENYHWFCVLINMKVKNTPELPSILLILQFEGKRYFKITIHSVFLFFSMAIFLFSQIKWGYRSLISDLRQPLCYFRRKFYSSIDWTAWT